MYKMAYFSIHAQKTTDSPQHAHEGIRGTHVLTNALLTWHFSSNVRWKFARIQVFLNTGNTPFVICNIILTLNLKVAETFPYVTDVEVGRRLGCCGCLTSGTSGREQTSLVMKSFQKHIFKKRIQLSLLMEFTSLTLTHTHTQQRQ